MKLLYLISAAALLLSVSVQAETIEEALGKCSNLDNSLKRLMCFDKVAKEVQQYSGVEEAIKRGYAVPKAEPRSNLAPQPVPRKRLDTQASSESATPFGLENKVERELVDEITATVVKIDKAPRGELIITLADGAVWRQKDSGLFNLKVNDEVKVERGVLGAFYLSKVGQERRIKVTRTN